MLLYLLPIVLFMSACGEDDGEGGAPDILLGLSGLIIAVIVVWFIYRNVRKR